MDLPEFCPFCKAPRWMIAENRAYFACGSSHSLGARRYFSIDQFQSLSCAKACKPPPEAS